MLENSIAVSPLPRLTKLILTTRVGNAIRNLITCKRLHGYWWKRSHRETCFYWTRSH
jgi:hypothetical protein